MPMGPARLAEPAPGIDVNLAILAAGFAVIVLAPLAVLAPAAWTAAAVPDGAPGFPQPAIRPGSSRLGMALGTGRPGDWQDRAADGVRAG